VRDGLYVLELHLDPERKADPFTGAPAARLLRGSPGAPPRGENVKLAWTGPDVLATEVVLRGDETLLAAVELPGRRPIALAPVCLPYSPEFRPDDDARGEEALRQLAAATGGKERVDMARVWGGIPRTPRDIELMPLLALLAALALLAEVIERRTGLFSGRGRAARAAVAAPETAGGKRRAKPWARAAGRPPAGRLGQPEIPAVAPSGPPEPAPTDTMAAMREARKRARRGLGRT